MPSNLTSDPIQPHRYPLWRLLAACLLFVSACEGQTQQTAESAADGTQAAAEAPRDNPTADGALTADRVASIAHTANEGEVQLGQLAVQRAKDPRVQQFAQRMIDDHSRANQQLASAQNPGPVGGPIAAQLQQMTQQTRRSLESAQGGAFDRAYIDSQVRMHTSVLEHLDNTLIPAAPDDQLRTVLQQMRETVAGHLRLAREIQGSLGESAR
jgi:putative membrane protein